MIEHSRRHGPFDVRFRQDQPIPAAGPPVSLVAPERAGGATSTTRAAVVPAAAVHRPRGSA